MPPENGTDQRPPVNQDFTARFGDHEVTLRRLPEGGLAIAKPDGYSVLDVKRLELTTQDGRYCLGLRTERRDATHSA